MTSNSLAYEKERVRQTMRARLAALSPQALPFQEENILFFLDKEGISLPALLSGYWPLTTEFDFRPLLYGLHQAGFSCALPVIQPRSRVLLFSLWSPLRPLAEGLKGTRIPQPLQLVKQPEVMFIPLLAFDAHGNRLGRGGGYFDATLKALRTQGEKRFLAIGVGFEAQAWAGTLPVGPQDEKIDGILTEKGLRLLAEK